MYLNKHISAHIGVKIIRVLGKDKVHSPYYQFLLVKKGSVVFCIDDDREYTLDRGSIVSVRPDHTYYCRPVSDNIIIGIRIDAQFIAELIPPGCELVCNSAVDTEHDYSWLARILTEICSAYYSGSNTNRMLSHLYEFSDCLLHSHIHRLASETAPADLIVEERIKEIKHYIEANYHQPVSLSVLSEKMFLTPQYLSRFIKKHMSTSFSRYLTTVRLNHAHSELIHTDHSIINIALNSGFPNISSFHKAFRERYGDSPGVYRAAIPIPKNQSAVLMELDSEEAFTAVHKINIDTAAAAITHDTTPIGDMINIGPLEHALEPEFRTAFGLFHSRTPFSYVRCYNVFSEKVIFFDHKNQEYNFYPFYEIIDYFYQHQVYLCLEISYKPPKDPNILPISWENTDAYGGEQQSAYYMKTLRELLLQAIRRYGAAYVEKWRFDIWCKTGEKLTLAETPQEYSLRYKAYYDMIKQLLPNCAVGGFGYNMCGSQETFTAYIKKFYRDHIPFDFISIYGFLYKTAGEKEKTSMYSGAILSPNPDHIPDTFRKYRKILRDCGYSNAKIYMTEFGSVLNVNGYITESLYQAGFLIHNILSLYTQADSIASLGWMDYTPWPLPAPDLYYPCVGLLTNRAIPKPALHAYSFLLRLGSEVLSAGTYHILTRTQKDHYQLLLYHYVHFNESYCFHPIEPVPLTNTYQILAEHDPIQIELSLDGFKPGRYKCRRHTLNEQHGCFLDELIRTLKDQPMDGDEYLRDLNYALPDELEYYRQTAVPRQELLYWKIDAGLRLELTLQPNEIVFYEFRREL